MSYFWNRASHISQDPNDKIMSDDSQYRTDVLWFNYVPRRVHTYYHTVVWIVTSYHTWVVVRYYATCVMLTIIIHNSYIKIVCQSTTRLGILNRICSDGWLHTQFYTLLYAPLSRMICISKSHTFRFVTHECIFVPPRIPALRIVWFKVVRYTCLLSPILH